MPGCPGASGRRGGASSRPTVVCSIAGYCTGCSSRGGAWGSAPCRASLSTAGSVDPGSTCDSGQTYTPRCWCSTSCWGGRACVGGKLSSSTHAVTVPCPTPCCSPQSAMRIPHSPGTPLPYLPQGQNGASVHDNNPFKHSMDGAVTGRHSRHSSSLSVKLIRSAGGRALYTVQCSGEDKRQASGL